MTAARGVDTGGTFLVDARLSVCFDEMNRVYRTFLGDPLRDPEAPSEL